MQLEIRLAIVMAEFNSEITDRMLNQALKRASDLKVLVSYVCKVPGSYDMPLTVQDMLEKDDVDAVVTLGAIVKGETKHDETIASALAQNLVALSLRYRKPVTLGVAGPGVTLEQAEARIDDYADRSVISAVKMVARHRDADKQLANPTYPVVLE